jgi:hypothetical protein
MLIVFEQHFTPNTDFQSQPNADFGSQITDCILEQEKDQPETLITFKKDKKAVCLCLLRKTGASAVTPPLFFFLKIIE